MPVNVRISGTPVERYNQATRSCSSPNPILPMRLLAAVVALTSLLFVDLPGVARVGVSARAALASPEAAAGATTFMQVDEVKPGMRGTGVTVFEGATRVEFQAEILGILPNVIGPRRSLILARLSGHRLSDTGVMQGMSGSPVYIGGRLIGAVSYSLGSFSKEPIAGITPIAEMIDATTGNAAPRPSALRAVPASAAWPPTREDFVQALRDAFARLRPAGAAAPLHAAGLSLPGVPAGASLQPMTAPFTMSGFSGDVQGIFQEVLGGLGIASNPSAAAAAATGTAALAPGDAVGVSLITGDLQFGATGTVTHVDGDRVYAFGHPFFNLGPTEFAMTKAWVQTLLPSLYVSAKLAAIGETVGTVRQDRATAIAGTLGAGPSLVPVSLALSSERGPARTFKFGVVKDQLFTPLLTFAAIVNTLQSYEREFGAATFTVRGQALVRDHGAVALEDVFTGDTPAIGAASAVSGPLTLLLRNDRQPVQIDGIDLTIQAYEEPRTVAIERVWLGRSEVRAGDTMPVHVLTRSYRGEARTHTIDITIPRTARGTLSLVVSDGTRLAMSEQRETRPPREAESVAQMIRVFNKSRRNNRIYVKLVAPAAGAVVAGEPQPGLPPSVLAVYEGDQPGGDVLPLSSAVLGEWALPSDHAVTGQRTLAVTLRQ
jgi:hypothetical protein